MVGTLEPIHLTLDEILTRKMNRLIPKHGTFNKTRTCCRSIVDQRGGVEDGPFLAGMAVQVCNNLFSLKGHMSDSTA